MMRIVRLTVGLTFCVAIALGTAKPSEADDRGNGHGIAGAWRFTLVEHSAKSRWQANIKQPTRGHLKGSAQPGEVDCRALVTGTLINNAVKMTWSVKSPCTSEVISLKGRYATRKMSGTMSDSRLGSGSFTASESGDE